VHGCPFRIYNSSSSKSYIVDPRFSKRKDAKAAVCFLAVSQGIYDYIQGMAPPKITEEMRRVANKRIFPALEMAYGKLAPHCRPAIVYSRDVDGVCFARIYEWNSPLLVAFGASLQLDERLPFVSMLPKGGLFTVEPNYPTKADARIAVLYLLSDVSFTDPPPYQRKRKRCGEKDVYP
jgi:hypothetical protein